MHALSTSRPRASDARPKAGGRASPPRRPSATSSPAHAPEPGCVISIRPFGKGVAFKVFDQVCNVVLEASTARSRDEAVERGRREVRRLYGLGEPIYVLEVLACPN